MASVLPGTSRRSVGRPLLCRFRVARPEKNERRGNGDLARGQGNRQKAQRAFTMQHVASSQVVAARKKRLDEKNIRRMILIPSTQRRFTSDAHLRLPRRRKELVILCD
uniref:Uncharacterized protein n=1 Tax=Plectus sambesii TaxID=2011161 RepID=A0A914VI69_9BILA